VLSANIFLPTPVRAAPCSSFHVAKANDSWTRIAARFDISLRKVLSLNRARTSTKIMIGDQICIPDVPAITTSTTTSTMTSTTTIATSTVSPSTIVVPKTNTKRNEVIAIIREIWPDEHEENALFVAQRESNLIPSVIGGTNNCCIGLFQMYYSVHKAWLVDLGITEPSQLLDARLNTLAAFTLFKRNGKSWKPWWTSSWRP
jgi:LysM repeat protein